MKIINKNELILVLIDLVGCYSSNENIYDSEDNIIGTVDEIRETIRQEEKINESNK